MIAILGRCQHVVEFGRACHQAHQIDFHHLAKAIHQEFAAAIDHRALRQHEDVELVEGGVELLDRGGIADIELEILQAIEMRAVVRRIIRRLGASAADGDARAACAKRLCDAVARCRWSRRPTPACR
jgi:hypothetical protein